MQGPSWDERVRSTAANWRAEVMYPSSCRVAAPPSQSRTPVSVAPVGATINGDIRRGHGCRRHHRHRRRPRGRSSRGRASVHGQRAGRCAFFVQRFTGKAGLLSSAISTKTRNPLAPPVVADLESLCFAHSAQTPRNNSSKPWLAHLVSEISRHTTSTHSDTPKKYTLRTNEIPGRSAGGQEEGQPSGHGEEQELPARGNSWSSNRL